MAVECSEINSIKEAEVSLAQLNYPKGGTRNDEGPPRNTYSEMIAQIPSVLWEESRRNIESTMTI